LGREAATDTKSHIEMKVGYCVVCCISAGKLVIVFVFAIITLPTITLRFF
jgi:hypothetical protein